MSGARILVCALLSVAPGCTGDTDPPWQLDHDRIIAVRATPPRIAAGEQAVLDALVGARGSPVAERSPDSATVVSPASLAAAIMQDAARGGARWVVTGPSGDVLAGARDELGLPPDAMVPIQIRVVYAGGSLVAFKTVWVGSPQANLAVNPAMADIEIDHERPTATELVVPTQQNIPLASGFDDASYDVTWLSSCGTMHDFDLPNAYLQVDADDATSGELVIVVRDGAGGVSWQVWPIRAE